jgi:hypothetical protein
MAVVMNQEIEPDVTEAMQHLIELLRGIDLAFDRKPKEPLTPQTEQQRYAAALSAIGRFLLKIDPKYADRFFDLGDALQDQSFGLRPPLLKPLKRKSSPIPTQVEAAKANVAFALDALIELDEEPEIAANRLVRQFPEIKNLAATKSHRANSSWADTLLGWRKELSAPKRKKNELAAEIFQAGRYLTAEWIKTGRQAELRDRALGRVKHAAQVGKFIGSSSTA